MGNRYFPNKFIKTPIKLNKKINSPGTNNRNTNFCPFGALV
jgi:hypothetical protein